MGGMTAGGEGGWAPDAELIRSVRLVIAADKDTFATQLPNRSLTAFRESVLRFFGHIAQMF